MRGIVIVAGLGLALHALAQDEISQLYESIVGFKRDGISLSEVRSAPDPFTYHTLPAPTGEVSAGELFTPVLHAILENRAKIGEVWLKQGEVYQGWKVLFVGHHSVRLESPSGEIRHYPIHESKMKVEKR